MAVQGFPIVEVAVTVFRCEGRLLLVFNAGWGAFTLPMTKRRQETQPQHPHAPRNEAWDDAAMRNSGECLGRTSTAVPTLACEVTEWLQSDRDGKVKRFSFQVYVVDLPGSEAFPPGLIAEWLLPEEVLDERRRPISPTARFLVGRLQAEAALHA
ncbi:MAG: hypothetical protein K1X74_23205 [Pirellulales bacterium]|nr:hypothetical protein [Pirellulales bacterium]